MSSHKETTPSLQAVDLEVVGERLYVDPRIVAKKLAEPVGGTSIAVDMQTFDAVLSGEAAVEVAEERKHPATGDFGPTASPVLTLTPSVYPMTPQLAQEDRWWLGEGKATIHGSIVHRTKEEVLQIRSEETPLLGRKKWAPKKPPAGVVEPPHPATAYIMPVDVDRSVLAVVEDEHDAESVANSIFPDQIKTIEVRLREAPDHRLHLYLVMEFARPLIGWAILLVGVTCMAAVGPVIKIMSSNNVSGYIIGCWNAQGLFFMFTTMTLLQGQVGVREWKYISSLFGFVLLACAGVISGLGSGSWTLSFMYTSVPQSYLFNSFHPTLIIAWRLLRGGKVLSAEKLGVAMGLIGASLSVLDGGGGSDVPLGDLLAFMSSLSLCFYLLASKKARNHLPLMLNLSFVTFFSAVSQLIVAHIFTPGGLTLDTDPTTGVFGWWNEKHFYTWISINLVTGIGQAGYIGALKYLNPVVVSICMTTEPVTATWFAMLLLGEGLPQMYTLIGGLLILFSSIVVSLFSVHSKENVEIDVGADTTTIAATHTPLPSPYVLPQKSPLQGHVHPRRDAA